jgi:phosphoglycerate kinase
MIKYIDQVKIANKRVLLRVDFNISLLKNGSGIANDTRIRQALPTIKHLLENKNKLILISHLGRPLKRDLRLSLKIVAKRLGLLLPKYKVKLITDFRNPADKQIINKQKQNEIFLLENIRFYPEEGKNNPKFVKELSELGDVYVNDAFGVSHRVCGSIVGLPKHLPAYGGLLLKKEIMMIDKLTKHAKRPIVAIVGGVKVSTKIHILNKLCQLADYLLIGGGLANTILASRGYELGKSIFDYEDLREAQHLSFMVELKKTKVILPVDAVVGLPDVRDKPGEVRSINDLPLNKYVLDIGPATQALFSTYINKAKTIIWNGPMGYFENPSYRNGTDFIFFAITNNRNASSLVGGGDTLAAISQKKYLSKITHLSSGGGAMLKYIETGTLPGIEVLK